MGGDGSVAVVWVRDEIYVALDFHGAGSYVFIVTEGEALSLSGVCSVDEMSDDLAGFLKENFAEKDACST